MRRAYTILLLLTSLLVQAAQAQTTTAAAEQSEIGNIVVHLETAPWGQSAPFNNLCFTSSGAHAVTGCVPTAFAIIMRYHQWPEYGTGKVYNPITGEAIELDGHRYNWENMPYNYRTGYTQEQANEVAVVMRDLGYAYGVTYGAGGTSCSESARPMWDKFGYCDISNEKSNTGASYRSDYSDKEWEALIKESLDAGCPIPYSSKIPGGRHIFILDGYTDNGYYHFNWGWGGQGNGWFKLDSMRPDAYSDYSESHRAYFMLCPEKGPYTISATVNSTKAGTATVNGEKSTTLQRGETATLVATPNEGYTFACWIIDDKEVSRESTYHVTVTGNAEYTACFDEAVAEVTVKVESTTGGKANVNGKQEITVAVGADIIITAIPDKGYHFTEWRIGEELFSSQQRVLTTALNDITYTAVFETDDTAIGHIGADGNASTVYDLSGRKVKGNVRNGLYIIDGKVRVITE